MRFLADSHVAYWAMVSPEKLSPAARSRLIDPENAVLVSAASIWELRLKAGKGKLFLPGGFVDVLREEGFEELPVSWRHAEETLALPLIHGDPFDRLLIAQALVEGLVLMTRDENVRAYDVPVFEA